MAIAAEPDRRISFPLRLRFVTPVLVSLALGACGSDTWRALVTFYAGRVTVQPHKYTGPEGHYLVVSVPSDTLLRIIFETNGRVVTRYRAGRRPPVDYVEGCS